MIGCGSGYFGGFNFFCWVPDPGILAGPEFGYFVGFLIWVFWWVPDSGILVGPELGILAGPEFGYFGGFLIRVFWWVSVIEKLSSNFFFSVGSGPKFRQI